MAKNLIILISLTSFIFSIGLKALVIPQNALSLASSSTGIADNLNIDLNPAALASQRASISFSDNNWYADMTGQKISVVWNEKDISYFSFESLSVTDIELRDEIANEEPIGFFGAYWYAADYSRLIDLGYFKENDISFGYKISCSLSKLYTESMRGITFDVGIVKEITKNLTFGFVARDIGREYYQGMSEDTEIEMGVGVSYNLKGFPLTVSSDILHRNENSLKKMALRTNFPYINFICGFTKGDLYQDYSFGLQMNFNEWSFVFGGLSHDNASLGNPTSLEIIKIF